MSDAQTDSAAALVAEDRTTPKGIDGVETRPASSGLTGMALVAGFLTSLVVLFFWVAEHPRWVQHEQVAITLLSGGLVYMGIVDAATRRISNVSTGIAALVASGFLAFTWFSGFPQEAVIGLVSGLGIGALLVGAYVFSPVRQLGGGDVKLIPSVVAMLGSLHALAPTIWLLFVLIFAMGWAILLKKMEKRPIVTMAPVMAFALIPAIWYFSELSYVFSV